MWRSQTNPRISRLVMLGDLSGGWQGAKRKFRRIRRGGRRVGRPCLHLTDRSSDCFLIRCRPGCETDDAIIDMKPQAVPSTQEVLAGLVERVTYHNAENGFCVLRAKARGHRDLVTVVGHAAAIAAGEWITASGEWVNDRTHGQQFKARFLRTSPPTSADGIEKYLSSGMIRGVGAVYAKKLVRAFGEKVFDTIEAEPERLREVTGIGPYEPAVSPRPGPNRRSFAKSWSSFTAMSSARRGRCAS